VELGRYRRRRSSYRAAGHLQTAPLVYDIMARERVCPSCVIGGLEGRLLARPTVHFLKAMSPPVTIWKDPDHGARQLLRLVAAKLMDNFARQSYAGLEVSHEFQQRVRFQTINVSFHDDMSKDRLARSNQAARWLAVTENGLPEAHRKWVDGICGITYTDEFCLYSLSHVEIRAFEDARCVPVRCTVDKLALPGAGFLAKQFCCAVGAFVVARALVIIAKHYRLLSIAC